MQNYLNKPIKELISAYPELGNILKEYGIACISCHVGSCLLRDIIVIHNLSKNEQEQMITKISKTIHPDLIVSIPEIEGEEKPGLKEIKYSPPLRLLVQEHALIKRWINLIPHLLANLEIDLDGNLKVIYEGIDFIRSYADKFHHAKEEDILFKYFDENLDIIKAMLKDHEIGRTHVKALIESADNKNRKGIFHHLLAYRELLTEHIKKEDEVLYPWMDRNLSVNQIGHLYAKFKEVEGKRGDGINEKYEKFISDLEDKFLKDKKEVKNARF